MSATPSPSADLPEGRVHLPNGLRRLFPRTFQGRLTLAFLLVVALTIGLVTVLVVNRLDDYFASQQKIDLDQRTQLIEAYVVSISDTAAGPTRPVIGLDGRSIPPSSGCWRNPASANSSPTSSARPTW